MTSKIHIKNLHKSFGHNHVLKGIDLDLNQGESLVVIGGSGTGKSVLIKCILNLLRADSGSIMFDGHEVIGESLAVRDKRLENIGMVFQGSALFDSLSVWENVAFGLMNAKKVERKKAKAIALEKLLSVGLDENVGALFPSELSGGMKRRVSLARAVATHPHMIFFDEPTAGLDPIFSGVINDLIRTHVKDLGATALTITHDMNSARKIADRIAMIHEGKIIWCGTPHEIDHCDNSYVQQFINGRAEGPIHLETTMKKRA